MFFPVHGDPYRNNVVLHLPMTGENNSTTFTDVSPMPKTITRNGDTIISTAQSKWGSGSGYFDGSSDYLSFPYAEFNFLTNTTTSFTINGWVYQTNTNYRCIVQHGDNGQNLPSLTFLALQSGTLCAAIGRTDINGALISESTTAIPLNQWVHVACCYNVSTSTLNVFLNGVKGSDGIKSEGTFSSPTTDVQIGAYISNCSFSWSGYMQDLCITKDVARYTADFTPPASPLPTRATDRPVQQSILDPSLTIARLGL